MPTLPPSLTKIFAVACCLILGKTVHAQLDSGFISVPFCADFTSETEFYEVLDSGRNPLWVLKPDSVFSMNPAPHHPNAWMTGTTIYRNHEKAYLYLPSVINAQPGCYTLSITHQYRTELYHDGYHIQFTMNGGNTWHVLGTYLLPRGFYNTEYVASLDNKPGWTGNSNGWVTDSIAFFENNITSLQFRILFATDYSITERGCAINRFCLKYHGTDCDKIGLDENLASALSIKVYPNPASSVLHVEMQDEKLNSVVASFADLSGRQVHTQKIDLLVGSGQVSVEGLAAGLYILTLKSTHQTTHHKIEVVHP